MNEIIHLELTDADSLLPCPFCGAEETELCNTWTAHYWLECTMCGCRMTDETPAGDADSIEAHQASKAAVITAWNTRAVPLAEMEPS